MRRIGKLALMVRIVVFLRSSSLLAIGALIVMLYFEGFLLRGLLMLLAASHFDISRQNRS